MAREESEKRRAIKFPPNKVKKEAMEYLHCTDEQLKSALMTGKLRYIRSVFYYLLYIHTSYKFTDIQQLLFLPLPTIRMYVHVAKQEISRPGSKMEQDINNLLTILKSK
jgi:hypothetical protein